jgi:SPP1 gp7 family putative phage head morphogenesis protein
MTVLEKHIHSDICSYAKSDRRDPTKTLTLRNAFSSAMGSRFKRLYKLIRTGVIDNDCFGLKTKETRFKITAFQAAKPPGYHAFDYPLSADKVTAFMEWLKQAVADGILEVELYEQIGDAINDAWTNVYIKQAYERGILRGRQELEIAGFDVPSIAETGGLAASFAYPMHADRAGLIFLRTFTDLKGITDAMGSQISKILAQGITEGKHPEELARLLIRTMSGPDGDLGITDVLGRYIPAERRAKMLARTEIIRAHHVATIQEYENWGVLGVKVKAEFQTAGDEIVCPICLALEGKIYTLDEARGMVPKHPNCRCIMLPVDVTDDK